MRLSSSSHVFVSAAFALLVGCDAATSDDPANAAVAPDARSPPGGEPDAASSVTPMPDGPLPMTPSTANGSETGASETDGPRPDAPAPDTSLPGAPPIADTGQLLGVVGIDAGQGDGGTSDLLHASFVTVGAGVPVARLLVLLAPDGDRCRPRESALEPIAPLVSVPLGQTLIVDAPGGTWATLSRTDAQGFTAYGVASGTSGTLPGGATLSLSGDPRRSAVGIALPDRPPALVATLDGGGQDPGGAAVGASREPPALEWTPDPSGTGVHVLLDLTIDGAGWRCELEDDGRATLDERLLTPAGADAGAGDGVPPDVRMASIARVRQAIVPFGDDGGDALLIRHRGTGTLSP